MIYVGVDEGSVSCRMNCTVVLYDLPLLVWLHNVTDVMGLFLKWCFIIYPDCNYKTL